MLKKIIEYLKKPTGWTLVLTYLLTAVFSALAILLAVAGQSDPLLQIISYPIYGVAAIILSYAVYTVVFYWGSMRSGLIALIRSVPFGARMLDRYGFRTVVFASLSLLLNTAYALFNGIIGILSRSLWYGALGGYYLGLTVMRGVLVTYYKNRWKTEDTLKQKTHDHRKFRTVGILLCVLPFTLSFAILEMVTEGAAFVHYDWTVFAFAAFAFYKAIMAVRNFFLARGNENATILALRNIGLADAMVTILALQSSLLYSFGEGADYRMANILTGAVVCFGTLAIGVVMIISSTKKLRSIEKVSQ